MMVARRSRLLADDVDESEHVVVQGVRAVLADIMRDERLDATALQTVGSKGWDGFTIIRRTR